MRCSYVLVRIADRRFFMIANSCSNSVAICAKLLKCFLGESKTCPSTSGPILGMTAKDSLSKSTRLMYLSDPTSCATRSLWALPSIWLQMQQVLFFILSLSNDDGVFQGQGSKAFVVLWRNR